MAKKPIEEKHELVKFIKNLYSEELQLNFAHGFDIYANQGNIFNIKFPDSVYCRIEGTIDLTACPSFVEWVTSKENSLVCFDNIELDDLRKQKMSDFIDLEKDIDKYQINLTEGKYLLFRFDNHHTPFNMSQFTIKAEIPKSKLTESVLTVYIDNENKVSFDYNKDYSVLFDSAIKNLKVIFKKDATYSIYATDKDENGFRYVAIEGKGEVLMLRQYFRVI